MPMRLNAGYSFLAVGVNRYANPRYNLNFAHQDAKEFAGFFTTQQQRLFSEVHTRVLLDEQATRGNILEGLDWLGGMAQNDMAIIFLAGHGQTSDSNHFYFLGHDADFEKLRQTGIKWTELRDTLQALPGVVILMADACHAGAATRENKRRDGSSVWNPEELARAFVGWETGGWSLWPLWGANFPWKMQPEGMARLRKPCWTVCAERLTMRKMICCTSPSSQPTCSVRYQSSPIITSTRPYTNLKRYQITR